MASSGTIWGQQVGTRPRLSIYWKAVRQDIPNNRTEVEATLRLHSTYSLNFSANKTGSLDGTAFTYTGGFSGTGQVNLSTKKFWVNHSSDGTKTQSISGSFNIAVKYSGVQLNSLSVSGNMSLDRIPRGSALSSASITALKNGTSSTLTIGRTVHSSAFYHLVTILDGSTWIWDSGYINGTPSTTHTLSSTYVDKMLNRMSSVTSKSYTVRLRTYTGSGGSGLIGDVSRSVTVSVHSDVKPSVNKPSVSIDGNRRDKSIGKYVQSFSKVKASVSGSAGYGASVRTYSMTVRRVGGSDSQSISGSSGTTSRPVALSGNYEVIGTVTDTRGRSNTNKATFTVDAYSPPAITSFTAVRNGSAQATVNITRTTTHSILGGGGNNNLSYSVQRRIGTGSWSNVNTKGSGTITASPSSDTSTSTGNAVTDSYEFRYVVNDQFGGRAESVVSVTTQRVVLDIHKNEGVGIGKIHERGVLDVDGTVYMNGKIMALEGLGFEDTRNINEKPEEIPPRAFSFAFKNANTIGGPPQRAHNTYAHILNIAGWNSSEGSGGYPMQMSIGRYGISLRQGTSTTAWSSWSSLPYLSTGINSDSTARWWRFGGEAGLQIITGKFTHDFGATVTKYVNLPASFRNTDYSVSISSNISQWQAIETTSTVGAGPNTASQARFQRFNNTAHNRTSGTYTYRYVAIGRWN